MFREAVTSLEKETSYYTGHSSDAALPYDGYDIWAANEYDLELVLIDKAAVVGGLFEARVSSNATVPTIKMRRAVQPVNVFVENRVNLAMFEAQFWRDNKDWLSSSIRNPVEVTCQFGKRQEGYIAGNMAAYSDFLKDIEWRLTRFAAVDRSEHHIHMTLLGRGERDPVQQPDLIANGIQLRGPEHYKEKLKELGYFVELIPEQLVLKNNQPVHIIRSGYVRTFFSDKFAEAVRTGKRPGLYVSNFASKVSFSSKHQIPVASGILKSRPVDWRGTPLSAPDLILVGLCAGDPALVSPG